MNILASQKAALQKYIDDRLAVELRDHLRQHHAGAAARLSDEALEARCRSGVEACRSCGIEDRVSLIWFALMAVEIGPRFHLHPALRRHLDDRTEPPERRILAALERTTPEDWEQAKDAGRAPAEG